METVSPTNESGTSGVATGVDIVGRVAAAIPEKPRRGRPPGSKNAKAVQRIEPSNGSVSKNSGDDARKNCQGFVETALFIFQSGDDFVKRTFVDRIERYTGDKAKAEQFRAEMLKDSLTARDLERLRDILTRLALKYSILQKIGPEVEILVFVVQYGVKLTHLSRAIERLKPVAGQPKPVAVSAN